MPDYNKKVNNCNNKKQPPDEIIHPGDCPYDLREKMRLIKNQKLIFIISNVYVFEKIANISDYSATFPPLTIVCKLAGATLGSVVVHDPLYNQISPSPSL